MRYLNIILPGILLCLTACNNNQTAPLEIPLPIRENFIPVNIEFDIDDKDFLDKIKPLDEQTFLVNSSDDLPDDPFGFSEAYYKINFKEETLIIRYFWHDYEVLTYSNSYFRLTEDESVNWSLRLGINGHINEDETKIEKAIFSRYAILVKKIPENSRVICWLSISDKNWDWNE